MQKKHLKIVCNLQRGKSMYGLLTRKNWEQKSVKAVSELMKTKTEVRATGEQWEEAPEVVIRWGCTANAPTKSIINSATGIHLVSNKSKFRSHLRIQSPDDIPQTWFPEDHLLHALKLPAHFPIVVRPKEHEKGQNFHVCTSVEEVEAALLVCGEGSYLSKFEQKDKEYRAVVIQGRVAFLCEKKPENKELNTWGLANIWKTIKWGDWPLGVVKQALRVHHHTGLTFSAVDIIQNKEGKSFVCEVNSAPELGGNYWAEKMAMCFDYIAENGKDPIPTDLEANSWKNFLHPALDDKVV
jgi:hypothetical protein